MVHIVHAVVRDGKVVLADLPFADGQRVSVTIVESTPKRSIEEIRAMVRGSTSFDDPAASINPDSQ